MIFPPDHAVHGLRMVAIDTETTGRDPLTSRVVEIACVFWRDGSVVERKSWLINPGCPIPQEAFEVHGIGDEQVKDAPPFSAIVPELFECLAGHVPVAYKRGIRSQDPDGRDRPDHGPAAITLRPPSRKGVEWVDPLVWARELQKLEKSRALGDVVQRLGIVLENAHRAAADAEATLHVFAAFLADTRVPKAYGALIQEQRRLARRSKTSAAGAFARRARTRLAPLSCDGGTRYATFKQP
ncbi:MAG: 3'-5' exonuclease [Pseudomonadota bacterium]